MLQSLPQVQDLAMKIKFNPFERITSKCLYNFFISRLIDLMHKSWSGPCILVNKNLCIVIGHITMRKFRFPRVHDPDHDLYIRSILGIFSLKHVSCSHLARINSSAHYMASQVGEAWRTLVSFVLQYFRNKAFQQKQLSPVQTGKFSLTSFPSQVLFARVYAKKLTIFPW